MSLVARTGARSQTFTFGALGATVTLQVVAPPDTGRAALALARAAIDGVATACSRTADSPLGTANAAPDAWHVVPPQLYLALERAARAHELTGALFDPRLPPAGAPAHVGPWRPAFDADRLAVRLGAPVDLGGIGTGIAVDLASAALSGVGDVHLVDAGRGRRFSGHGPDGDGWRVALEDPAGATGRLAVLRADDRAAEGFQVPAVHIEDRPRFPWRGLMMDVSRHWMPVEVVKRNLDAMAAVKLNVFHWHLSDDQGFRVESKRYPKLQEAGSDGHYYTQDEIRRCGGVCARSRYPGDSRIRYPGAYAELVSGLSGPGGRARRLPDRADLGCLRAGDGPDDRVHLRIPG